VFPLDAWRNFTQAGFEHFWVTDSVPGRASVLAGQPPFEVLSLDTAIAALLTASG
jgi:hypothetical protein